MKIIHIMADGTVLDSIEGHVVPLNDKTEVAYRLLIEKATAPTVTKEK